MMVNWLISGLLVRKCVDVQMSKKNRRVDLRSLPGNNGLHQASQERHTQCSSEDWGPSMISRRHWASIWEKIWYPSAVCEADGPGLRFASFLFFSIVI
jgi:hypothetical protein